MKPTRPLALIKNIFEAYHQPVPLSPENKQHLYSIITTSFRRQLDRKLGLPAEQPPQDSQQLEAAKSFENTSNLTLSSPEKEPPENEPRALSGSQHLRSILSNPLFSYDVSKRPAVRSRWEKDPMDIFQEAVARGLMTPLRAAGCLKAKRRQIMQSSAMDPVEVMASSGAGQRVVEWLRSSGLENNLVSIGDGPLMKHLIPFLVAEGMENTVWVWLDMLSPDAKGLSRKYVRKQRRVLFDALVESKYTGATSMNNAYACVLKAKEIFPWSKEENTPQYILSSWKKVAWESTVLAWKHLTKPSAKLFEPFYSIGQEEVSRQENGQNFHIEVAHLALHHPTKPSADDALKLLLGNDDVWHTWAKHYQALKPGIIPNNLTIRLRAFGLDAIKVCASQGQTAQAESLLEKMGPFLRDDFHLSADDLQDYEDVMADFDPDLMRSFR